MGKIFLKDGISIDADDPGSVSDGNFTFNELYEHRAKLFIALCEAIYSFDICQVPVGYEDTYMIDVTPLNEQLFVLSLIKYPVRSKDERIQISYVLPEKYWFQCRKMHCPLANLSLNINPYDGLESQHILNSLIDII